MTQKLFLSCGILASLLYMAMNIFIPLQWPDYSITHQTVSELSAIDAPTRLLWVPLGVLYGLLGIAFGWGVLRSAAGKHPLRITGVLLIISGLVNIYWPPMHQRAGTGSRRRHRHR